VWLGRRQPKEVATKIDGDPTSRAGVLERVPPCRIHAGRKCPSVKERSGPVVDEGCWQRVETQYDRAVEQLNGNEPDGGVEWCGGIAEEIGHGRRS
jgi:hypothetical protein